MKDRPATTYGASDDPGVITPLDADEVVLHGADKVHALGFDGAGVRVAVIDTGVDFAHPDLFNVSYRVLDPASPYFLHPVAYDAASMDEYLVFGETSEYSWYVNTSYRATVVEETPGIRRVVRTDVGVLSWNVTGVPGLSVGEPVRLGFHPDDKLRALWGARPGVILFNGTGSGAPYDSVLADLDGDMDFGDEKRAYINTDWATFDPTAELLSQDLDGDSIPDLSGGMVYFISDGVREIPYASRQVDVLNKVFQVYLNDNTFDLWENWEVDPKPHLVPAAGDLVLLFGDLDGPGDVGAHGTWATSAIAGQGRTGGAPGGPELEGVAPGVNVLGCGNNFGEVDPFGQVSLYTGLIFATEGYDGRTGTGDEAHIASGSWGGEGWTGWDWASRFADWVSTVHANGSTSFVFAAGNSGPGYGAGTTPAGGASLIVSGAMEDYHFRSDPWYANDGGPNPASGDVAGFSNRGPSAVGWHLVDVLTSGNGYGADPLNDNSFTADSGTELNGNSSWIQWAGTSLSTPNLAGILALLYDAYMDAHGGDPPAAAGAKRILKSSADDAHQDPFLSGAGIANALRTVLIASEAGGLTTSLDEWNPGSYRGTDLPGYANLLFPGQTDTAVVELENHRPSAPVTLEIGDAVVASPGFLSINYTRVPGGDADRFVLRDSGLFSASGTLVAPAPAGLFAQADVVRVSMWLDRGRMSSFRYLLNLYDWTDVDASGTFDGIDERNLMTQDIICAMSSRGPNGFAFVREPARRTHSGLVIEMYPYSEYGSPVDLTLRIDYYQRTDFGWLDVTPTSLTIPAASSASATLSLTVPPGADPGLYEAVVLFELEDGNVTTLPVVVNVGANVVDDGIVPIGGSALDSGPYQQGLQYGARSSSEAGSGDYRFYFLDVKAGADATVHFEWDSAASSNEVYILTNESDWFSENLPARYGPGTQETYTSRTYSTNGSYLFTTQLKKGLNILVSRSTYLAGIAAAEHPRGWVDIALRNTPPYASFQVSPPTGGVNAVFTVDASPSFDYEDSPASLQVRWDWEDDGSWDTSFTMEKMAEHRYNRTGFFTIRLEVMDTGGLTDTDTEYVSVSSIPPKAAFRITPEKPVAGEVVTFNASESSDPDGVIISYAWDFGDGKAETVTVPTVINVYDSQGVFSVTLQVRDDSSLLGVATEQITVSSADTQAPFIEHEPRASVVLGEAITIRAVVKDPSGVQEVILHYEGVDDPDFGSVPMPQVGADVYETDLAAETRPGVVRYYITATDKAGNQARDPPSGMHLLEVREGATGLAGTAGAALVAIAVAVVGIVLALLLALRARRGKHSR